MNLNPKRFLCAVMAVVVLAVSLPLGALAEGTQTAAQTLTEDDAAQMQQVDEAVTALTDSDTFAAMTVEDRLDAALTRLDALAEQGLVASDSVYVDEEHSMVSFAYPCGVLGGVLLRQPAEEDEATAIPLTQLDEENGVEDEAETFESYATAMIYYAFDSGVNSTRYPYYSYMSETWSSMGVDTAIDASVTAADLRRMGKYDLCILSAHGAYYTYTYGYLWKRTETAPIILLLERSDFKTDLSYGIDLLCHRIIKINGMYALTADFFKSAYRFGQLKNTIIYSETCEFLGVDSDVDTSIADALVAGGAEAVVGYVNNVYTVYSRSLLWDTVNQMIMGRNIERAVNHALETYGSDDLVWYNAQGGKRPHARAAYARIFGNHQARLAMPAYARSAARAA